MRQMETDAQTGAVLAKQRMRGPRLLVADVHRKASIQANGQTCTRQTVFSVYAQQASAIRGDLPERERD